VKSGSSFFDVMGVDLMYKSCKWCGSIHEEGCVCNKKPTKQKETTEAVKFRNSAAWQSKREEIKKRDKYLCQVCVREMYEPKYQYQYENLEVHHAVPIAENNIGHLDNNNLIMLCSMHHHMSDKHEIPLSEILQIIKEQEMI
jgi:5-methylcytosine-specific restriction endonuclease McrA